MLCEEERERRREGREGTHSKCLTVLQCGDFTLTTFSKSVHLRKNQIIKTF